LVGNRQTVLYCQFTELFVGAHDYQMRMIIKESKVVSTRIFVVTSKMAAA
jgi:hypothetical protein